MREEIPYELYLPADQQGFANGMTAYVRAAGDVTRVFDTLRTEARAVDAGVPTYDMRTLTGQMEISLLTERLLATLSSVFGCLATLLAALGLYGVMAFMVTRRTREIGIRMALGANAADTRRLILRDGFLVTLVGVGAGMLLALGLGQILASTLWDVRAMDPVVFLTAPLLLTAVALVACYVPARRAARVDPMVALRYE
jgi:ABC-type antimicrobial peptide transport system permease subunit